MIVLFVGTLSDRYGKKLPMCIVLAGFVAHAAVLVAMSLFPSWPVEVLYAATVSLDITGSWVIFNMAAYGYMADITSTQSRTKRMGWMDAVWNLGGPIGTLLGSSVFSNYGYLPVFAAAGVLWFICLVYVILVVKESGTKKPAEAVPGCQIVSLSKAAFRRYPSNGRFHLLSLMAIKLGVFLTHGHQVIHICTSFVGVHDY